MGITFGRFGFDLGTSLGSGVLPVLSISGTPGAATVGAAYSFTPTIANATGTKIFSRNGPALPAGLSFSTATGAITGTPTAAGTVTGISISVTDDTGTATLPGLTIVVNPVLAALPLATGARVAAIGDSQIGYNNTFGGAVSTASAAAYSTGYGFIEQASAHDQRFRFDNWYDTNDPRGLNYVGASQGIHGDHLDWASAGAAFGGGILGRLPALLARRPDIVIVEGGINTIATGDDGVEGTADYVIGKLDAALKQARYAGVWAILMVIYPRGDWINSSNPKMAIVDAVNVWIRAQAGRDGVLGILDAESLLRPGGVFDATMFKGDLIHLSPKGALAVGRSKLLPILQAAISAGSTFDKDPTVSSLLSANQANLAGTTGVQSGWPQNGSTPPQTFSGQLATGLTLTRGRSVSIVASKEVVAGSLEQQVLAITPGGSDSSTYFDFTLSGLMTVAEAHTLGQWYQAYLEVELLGDGLTFLSMTGGHRTSVNAIVTQASALLRESSTDYALGIAGGARTFWLQTEPFRLPDGAAATDKLAMSITGTGPKTAAAFTMKFRRPILRRIADPRPGWGY